MCLRFISVLLASAAFALVSTKDLSQYPLRVTILDTDDSVERHVTGYVSLQGTGYGNVFDGDKARGITFTYACGHRLQPNIANTAYPARWKKPDVRLELLAEELGANKQGTCELKVSMYNGILQKRDGKIVEIAQADYQRRLDLSKRIRELDQPTDTDLSRFPLRLMLLESNWTPNQYVGGVTGSGRANLVVESPSGASLRAVDFVAVCAATLSNTTNQGAYVARWITEGSKLLVQAREVGSEKAKQCDFTTTVRADRVYVQNQYGALGIVSQSDYAKLAATPKVVSPISLHPQIKPLLNNGDIATLNSMGMSSKVILAKIAESDCAFDTSPRALEMLKKASVPDEVLVEMIKCSGRTH